MTNLTPSGVPAPSEALGLTFDDMLPQPNESDVIPSEATTCTWFGRNIRLNVPPFSAAMGTVAETRIAIAMAWEGGIGILYRSLSTDNQAHMVDQVKRSEAGMAIQPVTIGLGASLQEMDEVCAQYRVSGLPVVDDDGMLLGIITNRGLRFEDDGTRPVSEIMTKMLLATAPVGISSDDALALLAKNKIEELSIIDSWGRLKSLITSRDFVKADKCLNAAKDGAGRLRVGTAVGFFGDARERAMALMEQGVDCVAVDTVHGRSRGMVDMIQCIKADPAAAGADVIGGNIATYAGARVLIGARADGVKAGVGPGPICITRVVAGVGVPQVTAIHDTVRAARPHGVPVIGDGGLQYSGDTTKAIVAGVNSVMPGSLLADCEESSGNLVFISGKQFKTYRGTGSLGATAACGRKASYSKGRYFQGDVISNDKLIPEGVEGRVAYRGPLAVIAYQLIGGLRQSMFYSGAHMIDELQERGRFVRVTAAGLRESYSHDTQLTAKAPNYWSR